jgi:outer membrane protein TolC
MRNSLKSMAALCWIIVLSQTARSQAPVSLDSCYQLALQNYPLVRRYGLIRQATELSVANLEKGYLPQAHIVAQATVQSDVPQIPVKIPGVDFPVPDKDQYRLYAEVSQVVYDGGVTGSRKALRQAEGNVAQQSLAVRLHQLTDRVNQLFFGVLLLDARLRQNKLLKKDILAGIDKAEAAVKEGAGLQTGVDVLRAAWLQAGQQTTELQAERQAFTSMLGLLIHRSLDSSTVFLQPPGLLTDTAITRPELELFRYRKRELDARDHLLSAATRPRVSLFGQAGYGRPAFNIFSNRFQPFYIAGIRMSIPLSRLYTLGGSRSLLQTQREEVDVARDAFLFHTRMQMERQDADIRRLRKMLAADRRIIPLRTRIKKASLSQLQNGVLAGSDYLREVNAEDMARQDSMLHAVKLLLAEYTSRSLAGHQP